LDPDAKSQGIAMTNQSDNFSDLMSDDSFEVVMRGYSRRQVHDHINRLRNQIRDLEERLGRAMEQAEHGRVELAEARRRLAEAPQDYDELGQRLSQILKLAEEEAAAKKQTAESEATDLRERAAAEAERLVTGAQEQAQSIVSAAQAEADRRVAEATEAAERLLAQAGADADETLSTARAEAEDERRQARGESDRMLTSSRHETERLVSVATRRAEELVDDATRRAEALVTAAQQRAGTLDDHTGRRVVYLTDTHTEVMRRLHEIGSVLTDLLGKEKAAGALIDEAAVLPPAPVITAPKDGEVPVPEPTPSPEAAAPAAPVEAAEPAVAAERDAGVAPVGDLEIPRAVGDRVVARAAAAAMLGAPAEPSGDDHAAPAAEPIDGIDGPIGFEQVGRLPMPEPADGDETSAPGRHHQVGPLGGPYS
jgi:cell division septum initiation protein DivIVA